MADADGATKFPDVEKLEKGLNDLRPWPVSTAVDKELRKEFICNFQSQGFS